MTDGDLGGTSTNRSFRVRLREEVDVEVENEDDNTMDGKDDEELDEINARRTEVIKFKLVNIYFTINIYFTFIYHLSIFYIL